MPAPAVVMHDITKTFPGLYQPVVANADVSLRVDEGEFHVIVGENGAGKSTLMNILYGLHQPDAGSIALFGRPTSLSGPKDAIGIGVGMIHQHFMLVPSFTVAENIVLGHEPVRGGLMDNGRMRREISQLAERVDLPIDLARVPPQHYPEQSGEQTVLLIGKEAIVAMPSPPRGRLLRPAR